MLKSLLLCFVIFANLGIFSIGPHSALAAAKETDQKPSANEDVKKKVEEAKKDDKDKPDKKLECVRGMKALSRPLSEPCLY